MGLYQTKSLLHSKRNSKLERQHMESERIFANYVTDNGLISKMYKELT